MTFKDKCLQVRHLFWEFYALNHLWFRLGNGAETYGYQPIKIVNENLRNKINFRFEEVTDKFYALIKDALERSIRSEMKYIFGAKYDTFYDAISSNPLEETDYYDMQEECKAASKDLTKFVRKHKPEMDRGCPARYAPISWAQIGFRWKGWNESYCGESWANGCEVYLETDKISHLTEKISWIDRALDLYHNNGFLLNKTEFSALEEFCDLDNRFLLVSWEETVKKSHIIECIVKIEEPILEKTSIKQRQFPLSGFTRRIIIANIYKI